MKKLKTLVRLPRIAITMVGWLVILFACRQPAHNSSDLRPRESPADIESILSWLPADTQTLKVANGPFVFRLPVFPDPSADTHKQQLSSNDLEDRFQALTTPEFIETFGSILQSQTVMLAVGVARRFRPPTSLGGYLYQGCSVAVMENDQTDRFNRFVDASVRESGWKIEEIDHCRVAVVQKILESDTWSFFVANPRPSVVIVATDREYLKTVLTRMSGGGARLAFPDALMEWKHVNRKVRFWGMRHYDRIYDAGDRTSPLAEHPILERDDQAIGVAYECSPEKKAATITYVSGNPTASRKPWFQKDPVDTKALNEWLEIKCRAIEPNVDEMSFTLSRRHAVDVFMLIFCTALGHGLII